MSNDTLTKNFNREEFACPCCGNAPIEREFVDKLQQLRNLWGKPIKINSGYRCKSHNKKVGGSPNSQHCLGTAADLSISVSQNKQLVDLAKKVGFTGIGTYTWGVHLDNRTGGLARW